LDRGAREVRDECIHGSDGRRPGALDVSQRGALRDPAFLADELTQPGELQAHLLVELDDIVKGFGDAFVGAPQTGGQTDGEVSLLQPSERGEQVAAGEAGERL